MTNCFHNLCIFVKEVIYLVTINIESKFDTLAKVGLNLSINPEVLLMSEIQLL